MQNKKVTACAVIFSLLYWLAESAIHRFVYSEEIFELFPSDFDELSMRLLIIILFIGLGLLADNRTARIHAAEKEKHDIFIATASATQHVLNNLLNQLQLVLYDDSGNHVLDDKTRKLLEQSIKEGKEQVERLSLVNNLDEKTIRESVMPK